MDPSQQPQQQQQQQQQGQKQLLPRLAPVGYSAPRPREATSFTISRETPSFAVPDSIRHLLDGQQLAEDFKGNDEPVVEPHENDVLCGRGGRSNHHIGNLWYRDLIQCNRDLYRSSRKIRKQMISKAIIASIRSQTPPGRFLEQKEDGMWHPVSYQRALLKTSQALRDSPEDSDGRLQLTTNPKTYNFAELGIDKPKKNKNSAAASQGSRDRPGVPQPANPSAVAQQGAGKPAIQSRAEPGEKNKGGSTNVPVNPSAARPRPGGNNGGYAHVPVNAQLPVRPAFPPGARPPGVWNGGPFPMLVPSMMYPPPPRGAVRQQPPPVVARQPQVTSSTPMQHAQVARSWNPMSSPYQQRMPPPGMAGMQGPKYFDTLSGIDEALQAAERTLQEARSRVATATVMQQEAEKSSMTAAATSKATPPPTTSLNADDSAAAKSPAATAASPEDPKVPPTKPKVPGNHVLINVGMPNPRVPGNHVLVNVGKPNLVPLLPAVAETPPSLQSVVSKPPSENDKPPAQLKPSGGNVSGCGGALSYQKDEAPVRDPHDHDVLCGRGGLSNNHPGNLVFRELVKCKRTLYNTSRKFQKMQISKAIVATVRSQDPPGRFLEHRVDNMWHLIPYDRAVSKTSQALRQDKNKEKVYISEELSATVQRLSNMIVIGEKDKSDDTFLDVPLVPPAKRAAEEESVPLTESAKKPRQVTKREEQDASEVLNMFGSIAWQILPS